MSLRSVVSFHSRLAAAMVSFAAVLAPGGCVSTATTPAATSAATPAASAATAATATTPQTGIVRMRPDRSLEVRLLDGGSGGRVDGVRIVSPEHRDYGAILALTGPMLPGDQRPYHAPTTDE